MNNTGLKYILYFGSNLRFLRNRDKKSQEHLSSELEITRARLNSYENGVAQNPPLSLLLQLSSFFKISIDHLLCKDLSKINELKIRQLQEEYINGGNIRVLSTTIDSSNRENIELVPIKARAGYTAGYNDPEFISTLPVFQLPFLSSNRKYRAFQTEGDSMLPIPSGSYVIGEYVLNWNEIKDGQAYIVVTEEDGVVFKLVKNEIQQKQCLGLISLNTAFEPYEVPIYQVREIWKFINYFSKEIPEPMPFESKVMQKLEFLQKEISSMQKSS